MTKRPHLTRQNGDEMIPEADSLVALSGMLA